MTTANSSRPPVLALSEHSVDFGTAYVGDPPSRYTIALHNDGDGELGPVVASAPEGIDVAVHGNAMTIEMSTKAEHRIDGAVTISSMGGRGQVRVVGEVQSEAPRARSWRRYVIPAAVAMTLVGAIGAGIVALLSNDSDGDEGSTDIVPFGPMSFGETLMVDLDDGVALVATGFGAADGDFMIAATPLEGQDVVLSALDLGGNPVSGCIRVDLSSSGGPEECAFAAGVEVDGIVIEPYGSADATGAVEVTAVVGTPQFGMTSPAESEGATPPAEPEDATPPPESEDATPPAEPEVHGPIAVGETIAVALDPGIALVAMDIGDTGGNVYVAVEPLAGQDVVVSLMDAEGDFVAGCERIDNLPGGELEFCEFTAGVDAVNGIVVEPFGSNDATGNVQVSAFPVPDIPSAAGLFADFAPDGWDYNSERAEDGAVTCDGDYPTGDFDSHSVTYTSSTTGEYAAAFGLVFDTETDAIDYMDTLSGTFQPGCLIDAGSILQLDSMEVSEGTIFIEYTMHFPDGSTVRGNEVANRIGRVVMDPSCDRGDARVISDECSDFFLAILDHLVAVLE